MLYRNYFLRCNVDLLYFYGQFMRAGLLFVVSSIFIFSTVSAQVTNEVDFKKKFGLVDGYLFDGDYYKALPIAKELYAYDSSNANIAYMLGTSYLGASPDRKKAIYYLEQAIMLSPPSPMYKESDYKEKSAPGITYYNLAKAYHFSYRFDDAISNFYNYRSFVDLEDVNTYAEVKRQIEYAENAKLLIEEPVNIKVQSLGSVINSKYEDYSPVISGDGNTLIFTSRREGTTGGKLFLDGKYYEDIYIAKKERGKWTTPRSIGVNINTEGHEATIGLSPDGQQLFIYKDDNGDGNIYMSKLNGAEWSKPEKLGGEINTGAWETHATVSADGQNLFLVSNRSGGLGGRDIYKVSLLPDGTWGKAENLGSTINTAFDEEAPFFSADGKTLIFSSQGHNSMGGFDIFTSENIDGVWSTPVNIGYPINSPEDDVFFITTPDGHYAYYSSRMEGGMGEKDIYLIELTEKKKESLTVMKGVVILENSPEILANITVADARTNAVTGIYKPNKSTGSYIFILQPGATYNVTYECEGYQSKIDKIVVPENSSYAEITKAIMLDPVIWGIQIAQQEEKKVEEVQQVVGNKEPENEKLTELKALEEQLAAMEKSAKEQENLLAEEKRKTEEAAKAAEEKRLSEESALRARLVEEKRKAEEEARFAAEKKKEEELASTKSIEEKKMAEAAAKAKAEETARLAEQEKKKDEELASVKSIEEKKNIEAAAKAKDEQAALIAAEEKKKAEEFAVAKAAEDKKIAEAAAKAKDEQAARLAAEEKKKAQELTVIKAEEDKMIAEEAAAKAKAEQVARIATEEKKKAEELAIAKAAEDKKIAEEAAAKAKAEQAARLAAEEKKKAEEFAEAKAEQEKKLAEETARLAEEKRKADEAAKLAAEKKKQEEEEKLIADQKKKVFEDSLVARKNEIVKRLEELKKLQTQKITKEKEELASGFAKESYEEKKKQEEQELAEAKRKLEAKQAAEKKDAEERAALEAANKAKIEEIRNAAQKEEEEKKKAEEQMIAEKKLADEKLKSEEIARKQKQDAIVKEQQLIAEEKRKADELVAKAKAEEEAKNQAEALANSKSIEELKKMNQALILENEQLKKQIAESGNKINQLTQQVTDQNKKYEELLAKFDEIQKQQKYQSAVMKTDFESFKKGGSVVLKNILFDYNLSIIKKESEDELQKLYLFMSDNMDIKVEVSGHTDSHGNDEYNIELSKDRANAVVRYLVRKGIDANRFKAVGMGEAQPIAINENPDGSDNPEGRKLNRRIEIRILNLDAKNVKIENFEVPKDLKPKS
jgi:outer membrane protein OmpA-like peptidoglycan-associated protein